ncbi:MAG TPA: hypothetical protein VMS55_03455 [Myxococcota bacterium]|nr:hypothetical protein [Myxococcota bacterium]
MPTTTRSSELRVHGPLFGALAVGAGALGVGLALGCVHTPAEAFFQLTPESAQHRAAETRQFETSGEDELLSASAAVLQDLGFQVVESVREVGFLRAVKERSAREYGPEIWRGIVLAISSLGLISGQNSLIWMPVDLQQQIDASLVSRPIDAEGSRHEVRILFYRVVWKSDGSSGNTYIPPGEQRMETIRDPRIYQLFFAKLSKAVFLEAHKI